MIPFVRTLLLPLLNTAVVLAAAVTAPNEVTVAKTIPPDLFRQAAASFGRPDASGVFGQNKGGTFVADNQRRAMGLLVSGVILDDDTDLADGWRALDYTYGKQEPSGAFGKGKNESEVESMSFFMAWCNHGLYVLMNSSKAPAFSDRIKAILPKVELAMDRLMTDDAHAALTRANLHSPNRTLIMANAYAYAALVLGKQASADKVAAYRKKGQFWVDNAFKNDKLYRSQDGVFLENKGGDTSYQAVALQQFHYYMLVYPDDVADAKAKSLKAGAWLVQRILADGSIDCTNNRRSGLDNLTGDKKNSDHPVIMESLLYWSVLHNRSDGLEAVRRLTKNETKDQPPAIFSPDKVAAKPGVALLYEVMANNAGAKELSPKFAIELTDLPSWLKREANYGYVPSSGILRLTGTPPKALTVKFSATAVNEFGKGQAVSITLEVR